MISPSEIKKFHSELIQLQKNNKYGESLEKIESFKIKYGNSHHGYWAETEYYARLKDFDKALSIIPKLLELTPKNTHEIFSVSFSLGRICMKAALLEDAIPFFEKAVGHSYFEEDAHWHLTEIYIKLEIRAKAQQHLDYLPEDFDRVYLLGRKHTTKPILQNLIGAL